MTEEADTPDLPEHAGDAIAFAATARVLPGAVLRNLRESRQISIADVAQALKFSPRQIEALERDDFAALPGMTFVRGFIRSYARWLKTDAEPLLFMLDDESPVPAPEIRTPEHMGAAMPRPRSERSRWPILAAALVVIATLAAIGSDYFMHGQWPVLSPLQKAVSKPAEILALPVPVAAPSPEASSPPVAPVVPPPTEAATTLPLQPPPAAAPSPASTSTVTQPLAVNPVIAPTVPVAPIIAPQAPITPAAPLKTPGTHELVFVFEGKSWVEVKDATQRILLAQNNAPGSRQAVSGKPPFQVVIGNANKVKLQLDERSIDLVPHIRAEVARLTVE